MRLVFVFPRRWFIANQSQPEKFGALASAWNPPQLGESPTHRDSATVLPQTTTKGGNTLERENRSQGEALVSIDDEGSDLSIINVGRI
jgi:hypothetical protein